MAGYKKRQKELIKQGLCPDCAIRRPEERYTRCAECRRRNNHRQHLRRAAQYGRDAGAALIQQTEWNSIRQWLRGPVGHHEIVRIANLKREHPDRWLFFKALIDERRWTVEAFSDADHNSRPLNSLVRDCLEYAKTIPDPAAELAEMGQWSPIETRNSSITYCAMQSMEAEV